MATKIPEDMVDFLESGVSILVGTRNAKNEPESTYAAGAHVSADREKLALFLPAGAARSISDVSENGEISVCFSRLLDHHSIQLKGGGATVRDATDADRPVSDRYKVAFCEQLYMGGFPRSITKRFRVWPAKVVDFTVRDIFVQTPGPGAGARLGEK